MGNKLLIVGIGGLALSVVCITSAAVLGGQALRDLDWDWTELEAPWHKMARCPAASGRDGERVMDWDGASDVALSVTADARWRRGEGDKLIVRGDNALLSHIRIHDGAVKLDCRHRNGNGKRLEVVLPGRDFDEFSVRGSGKLALEGVKQPSLELNIAGSGSISMQGNARHLEANIMGSGDIAATGESETVEASIAGSGNAYLGDVAARRAEINIAGSGDVEASPRDSAEVHIAGSGDVRLRTRPARVETHIAGSGKVIQGEAPAPPEPPQAPEPPKPLQPTKI